MSDCRFHSSHFEEAWAILSPAMMVAGKSLEGFNRPDLQADIGTLGTD